MGIKVTDITIKVENPKEVDYNNLTDEDFFNRKISQSFSLIPKILHITKLLKIEHDKVEEIASKAQKPMVESQGMSITIQGPVQIDTTTLSSLEFSLLLLQFTYVEALCNVLSECAVRKNKNTNLLNDVEIDFLQERKGNYKNRKVEYSTSFTRIEDKVKDYLELFCKANKEDFKFDKSSHYWGNFKYAKKIRDDISHPRNGIISSIERDALFKMSCFIYWYTEVVNEKFIAHCNFNRYRITESWTFGCLELINNINNGGPEDIKKFKLKHESINDVSNKGH